MNYGVFFSTNILLLNIKCSIPLIASILCINSYEFFIFWKIIGVGKPNFVIFIPQFAFGKIFIGLIDTTNLIKFCFKLIRKINDKERFIK